MGEKHRVKRKVLRDTYKNGRTYGYVGETPTKTAKSPTKTGDPYWLNRAFTIVLQKKAINHHPNLMVKKIGTILVFISAALAAGIMNMDGKEAILIK